MLLNIPPDRRGLIPERDEASLRGVRAVLDATFDENLAHHAAARTSKARWKPPGNKEATPVPAGVLFGGG